jgi:hypothetical protein
MPRPADVAARTSAAIRSLTDEQIVAVMTSSQRIEKRVLPNCWGTVKKAAPDLAGALDELHSRELADDLPRFEAMAAEHEKQLSKAVNGRAGKITAILVIAAILFGIATITLGLTAVIGSPVVIAGAALSVGLFISGFVTGSRLAHRSGNWLLADPEAAASIVWDAGIDAAAATALKNRAGQDGLTPDVLRALSAVWAGAGLDTTLLTPPAKPAPSPGMNPFVLTAAHKIFPVTVVQTGSGEMFRFRCKCGQSWDSSVESENELAAAAAHIKDITEEAAVIARGILDRARGFNYPLTSELRGLLEAIIAEAAR